MSAGKRKVKPLRVSVSLIGLSDERLVVRTEKQDDGSYKSVVIHTKKRTRRRGMSVSHDTYEDAAKRVETLVKEAVLQGWQQVRRNRSKQDEFEDLPKPAAAR